MANVHLITSFEHAATDFFKNTPPISKVTVVLCKTCPVLMLKNMNNKLTFNVAESYDIPVLQNVDPAKFYLTQQMKEFGESLFRGVIANTFNLIKEVTTDHHQCLLYYTHLYQEVCKQGVSANNKVRKELSDSLMCLILSSWLITGHFFLCPSVHYAMRVFIAGEPDFVNTFRDFVKKYISLRTVVFSGDSVYMKQPSPLRHSVVEQFLVSMDTDVLVGFLLSMYPNVSSDVDKLGTILIEILQATPFISYALYCVSMNFVKREFRLCKYFVPFINNVSCYYRDEVFAYERGFPITSYLDFRQSLLHAFGNALSPHDSDFCRYLAIIIALLQNLETSDKMDFAKQLTSFWSFKNLNFNDAPLTRYFQMLGALTFTTAVTPEHHYMLFNSAAYGMRYPYHVYTAIFCLGFLNEKQVRSMITVLNTHVKNLLQSHLPDLMDAIVDVYGRFRSMESRRLVLNLFRVENVKFLKTVNIWRYLELCKDGDIDRDMLNACFEQLWNDRSDINLFAKCAAYFHAYLETDIWIEFLETTTNTCNIFRFIHEFLSTLQHCKFQNREMACCMGLVGIIGDPLHSLSLVFLQKILNFDTASKNVIIEAELYEQFMSFIAGASDIMLDYTFSETILKWITHLIINHTKTQRKRSVKIITDLLCIVRFPYWTQRKVSTDKLPHIVLLKRIITPCLLDHDLGKSASDIALRQTLVKKILRAPFPDYEATKPFMKNFMTTAQRLFNSLQEKLEPVV